MKLRLFIPFLFLSTLIYFSLPVSAHAALKRTRKAKATSITYSAPRGVKAIVRLRPDHLGLLINFSNFDNLASGRYELVYNANGVQQGAGGSILLGNTDTKELLFATCSTGVCTFHKNITNARLSIVSTLKDGTTVLKPYRIKV